MEDITSLREKVASSPRVGDELVMHGARISYVVIMEVNYNTLRVTRDGWVKNPESGAWEPCRTRFLEVPLLVWRDLVDLAATVSRDPLLIFMSRIAEKSKTCFEIYGDWFSRGPE